MNQHQRSRLDRLERRRPPRRESREAIMERLNAKLDDMRQRLGAPEPTPDEVAETLAMGRAFLAGLRKRNRT